MKKQLEKSVMFGAVETNELSSSAKKSELEPVD
jgi:hypothetical protein